LSGERAGAGGQGPGAGGRGPWGGGPGAGGRGLVARGRAPAGLFEQPLEGLYGQVRGIRERGGARLPRDLLVMRAASQQAIEGLAPRRDLLRGDLGHGHHLLVELRLVLRDGVDGQQVGHAHLGFGNAADVGGYYRDAAQHGLEHDARTRLGPQRGDQQDACAAEQHIDIVYRRKQSDVGVGAERGAILEIGAPGRHGGEARFGERIRQGEEDGNAFDGAGIHQGDEFVLEAAQYRPLAGLEKRDGHVNGGDAGEAAEVIGHILADAHHAVGRAETLGLGLAGEGAIGTEGHGECGARQVDDARARDAQGGIEQKLRGIVRGGEDYFRPEGFHALREAGAEAGVGRHVNVHAGVLEHHDAALR